MNGKRRYQVAITTPYPAPNLTTFYQKIALNPRIDLTVYYYSEAVLERYAELGIKNEDWDIDLVGKFENKFLKNRVPARWSKWRINPFRFVNTEIYSEMRRNRFDAVVLGNWDNVTSWIAMMTGKFMGTPLLVLSDSNYDAEEQKSAWKALVKNIFLRNLILPAATVCLYPGDATRRFYKHYGVTDDRLFHFRYSIDTELFTDIYEELKGKRAPLRVELGIPENAFVSLFVGRLHIDDLPMDLLKAYEKVDYEKKALVFVGDGPLLKELKEYTAQRSLKNVYFPGFQNRMKLPNFYASSDVFIHPASFEPWGMTVHEAMCFGLPVISTDKVGSAVDLVKHDCNGYIYPCGDVKKLASYIEALSRDKEQTQRFREASLEIVKDWGPKKAGEDLVRAMDFIYKNSSAPVEGGEGVEVKDKL